MIRALYMANSQELIMNDHNEEEDAFQKTSRGHAWNQSTTSWGNFPGVKRLSKLTPKYNESDTESDSEDMFSIFAWSTIVARDQFSKDGDHSPVVLMKEVPLTYAVEMMDLSTAEPVEVTSGHRRSRRRASMGGSRPYSKSPGDITRRERFHDSRSKGSNCSNESLSGDDGTRKVRNSRSSRKVSHSSSSECLSGDEETRNLRKSRSSRKSSQSKSYAVPDGEDSPRVHRRAQRRASMPLMQSLDTAYPEAEPLPQASRKSSHSKAYSVPDVDVELEEPARVHRRTQRRASMPLMHSLEDVPQEPEREERPRRSLGLDDVEAPARRSVRAKRRESLSSSSMTRTNELPKPRPVDMRLFPQAMPFLEERALETPEAPPRSGRMARRSSMPNSMSYPNDTPKPRPLDTSLLSPVVASAILHNESSNDQGRRSSGGRTSRTKRPSMSTSSYGQEPPMTPGGYDRDRLMGTRQVRRKSNDHPDLQSSNDYVDDVVVSSHSRRRESPTHAYDHDDAAPHRLPVPEQQTRRSGRMSRRSSM